ncbi:MAG: hypothetical protein EF806_01580 [Candidatus Methanoliparum thermophilum]|uniref:KEOPS complex subunit n=1 Tax=Methanoliparum thermophilum TaxID=2491083 RepID=A0A520KTD6_METT2|nr:KEOPS complex subunit Pcc1 [Candidatus Methanoliparum sp. LAM-1]RZN65235.1 MAG: hypothetical protein EF806_01580 [Candidatus Methanoliparum thermophilum]BDC36580.1 hypothetical protein MTLP_12620 [Candidatus Methanoliparum sp. LAM-1]
MKIKGRIYIRDKYSSLIDKAISPDNIPSIKRYIDDEGLEISVDSSSIGSLLLTLDDLLINIKVTMDIYNILDTKI